MRDIDYSNTIFYKIYCKNLEISDIYIGHTTNFVTRQHGHKQSCTNERNIGYNTKVYQFIREHGGWDNWKMEIVGYKCCKNMREACEEEQRYYDEYNATLNSIPPLQAVKNDIATNVTLNDDISCHNTNDLQHELSIKHITNLSEIQEIQTTHNTNTLCRFVCETCKFSCSYKSDYDRHISTKKHNLAVDNKETQNPNASSIYSCVCGKQYKHRTGLSRHKSTCAIQERTKAIMNDEDKPTEIIQVLKLQQEENNGLKKLLIQQQQQHSKQIQQLLDNMAINF